MLPEGSVPPAEKVETDAMSSSLLGLICLESEPSSLINPSGALWVFVSVQGFGIPAPALSITPRGGSLHFQERQKRVKEALKLEQ